MAAFEKLFLIWDRRRGDLSRDILRIELLSLGNRPFEAYGAIEALAKKYMEVNTIIDRLTPEIKKRYGSIEEQVRAILFLASDEASYITGTVLPVGGGDVGMG